MINHDSCQNVISPFNPLINLYPHARKAVNERFVIPILEYFFKDLGGIGNYEELDIYKLKTDIEFKKDVNYVKEYLYKVIVDSIFKDDQGIIKFKPRYSISFDSDLTDYNVEMGKSYPYKLIFNNVSLEESPIQYGSLKLGEAPVLYIIYIDFQQVIRFIKTLEVDFRDVGENKIIDPAIEKRNSAFNLNLPVRENINLNNPTSQVNKGSLPKLEIDHLTSIVSTSMHGAAGKLRVNLAWNSTDDLDLFVDTPNGKISYINKTIINNNIIGELDVDRNAGIEFINNPQENINWNGVPEGKHVVSVNFFKCREKKIVRFTVTILAEEGDGRVYNSYVEIDGIKTRTITSFEYYNGELRFNDLVA